MRICYTHGNESIKKIPQAVFLVKAPKTRGRRTQTAAERKCQFEGGQGNPKKSVGHLLKTPQMKYWFMDQHRSSHGVQRMCRVIGASRSEYYAWKRQPQSKRQKENEK
ncbi:MAG: hypothetical protein QMD01_02145, partial [Thermodesulfovibrionales bacterium]|nr:hypothetical protein [Thermodesulfovibrionales bacterium]